MEYDPEIMIAGRLAAVSSSMLELWKKIMFAGTFSKPVLVTGETGTGKELVAGLIHEASDRSKKPFVPVNCAAIPDHLFESEFFGHRKGCFTGAATDRKGFFEEADGGTLFLDEVGELTSVQQVKLLRVLQEGKIRRIGENVERPVDVRIISATNRNLEKMIDESAFREDFYYRISVDQIHIEPLRKRPEDIIPLIALRLCGNGNGTNAGRTVRIEDSVLRSLQVYHWPGNVRELFSILDRLAYMGRGGIINFDMLPERIRDRFETDRGIAESKQDMQEHGSNNEKLKKVMNICRGNKAAAARWLGISRGTLYKELKRSGLGYYIR
jgi:transcriptional regulator with PAS, ATPase and Fis domain